MRKLVALAILFFVSGPAWATYPVRETPTPAAAAATTDSPEVNRLTPDKRDWILIAPKCGSGCKTPPKRRNALDTDSIRPTLNNQKWISVVGNLG